MRESPSTPISPSTSQQTAANKKATPQGGFFVLGDRSGCYAAAVLSLQKVSKKF